MEAFRKRNANAHSNRGACVQLVETGILRCNHCGNRAPQTRIHSQPYEDVRYGANDEETVLTSMLHVSKCETCSGLIVYHALKGDEGERDFTKAFCKWPLRAGLPPSVPTPVVEAYEKAVRLRHVDSDAFAVSVRVALERLCLDQDAGGRTLFQRLESLASNKGLPPALVQTNDALRTLGNAGAHAEAERVRPGDVEMIDEFFRLVVEYVYVLPERLAQFEAAKQQRGWR